MRFRESMERFFPEKIPVSVPSEPEPTGKGSKPVLIAMPGGSPSEEESVWEYAGGKRMDWKPIGSTPAGRKCEVLTFDGSEEVLVDCNSDFASDLIESVLYGWPSVAAPPCRDYGLFKKGRPRRATRTGLANSPLHSTSWCDLA